jgi:hypothetical protein
MPFDRVEGRQSGSQMSPKRAVQLGHHRWDALGGRVISCQTSNERVIGGITQPPSSEELCFLLMWWPVDDDGSGAMETFLGKFVCDLCYMVLPRRMSSHATTTTTHTTT